jgi:NTP pyrophosphatase (non-canonical NTP hydrolase)
MIDMLEYQVQVDKLQAYFNSKSKPINEKDLVIIRCVLGMNEETGELAHVVLKSITGHYGFDDKEKVKRKAVDAVIDTMVFGLQVLNEFDVSFEEAFPKILDEVIDRNKNNVEHVPTQR